MVHRPVSGYPGRAASIGWPALVVDRDEDELPDVASRRRPSRRPPRTVHTDRHRCATDVGRTSTSSTAARHRRRSSNSTRSDRHRHHRPMRAPGRSHPSGMVHQPERVTAEQGALVGRPVRHDHLREADLVRPTVLRPRSSAPMVAASRARALSVGRCGVTRACSSSATTPEICPIRPPCASRPPSSHSPRRAQPRRQPPAGARRCPTAGNRPGALGCRGSSSGGVIVAAVGFGSLRPTRPSSGSAPAAATPRPSVSIFDLADQLSAAEAVRGPRPDPGHAPGPMTLAPSLGR